MPFTPLNIADIADLIPEERRKELARRVINWMVSNMEAVREKSDLAVLVKLFEYHSRDIYMALMTALKPEYRELADKVFKLLT